MKTETEIINEFERAAGTFAHRFYLNALLFCIGRDDLKIDSNTDKNINDVLKQLKGKDWKPKIIEPIAISEIIPETETINTAEDKIQDKIIEETWEKI
jgi:hypothetical protein